MANMPIYALWQIWNYLCRVEIIQRGMKRNSVFLLYVASVRLFVWLSEKKEKTNKYGFHSPANVYSEFF